VFSPRDMVALLVVTLMPAIPLALTAVPLAELISHIIKMVLT